MSLLSIPRATGKLFNRIGIFQGYDHENTSLSMAVLFSLESTCFTLHHTGKSNSNYRFRRVEFYKHFV